MSNEQKPGDPADKAADGAFGGVHSHRAGYGDDKLARLVAWLRAHPTTTLASGEGALLLAEVDRMRGYYGEAVDEIGTLRGDLHAQADWADWAKAEIDRLREQLRDAHIEVFHLGEKLSVVERERDQLMSLPAERILAALREPSVAVVEAVCAAMLRMDTKTKDIIRAAVKAAEQEVGRE